MDNLVHDSNNLCSGITPSDTELLHTFELVAVNSVGVDCDSSWSWKYLNWGQEIDQMKKKNGKNLKWNELFVVVMLT